MGRNGTYTTYAAYNPDASRLTFGISIEFRGRCSIMRIGRVLRKAPDDPDSRADGCCMAELPAEELSALVTEFMSRHNVAAHGVADLTWLAGQQPELIDEVKGVFTRAIVLGVRLQDAVVENIDDRPTPLYFHNYRQANYFLDRVAFELAGVVQAAGYAAMAVPASQIVSWEPMRGHLSHKLLGWAAGIGWIGRTSLLVHPRYGARMRYVSVLTDAPLQPGEPHSGSCGQCTRCVEVCPAGAVHTSYRDFDLDACYRKLTEFSRLRGIGQHICGVCVKACRGADAQR